MILDEGDKPCIILDIEDKYFLVGVFLWIRVFNDVENVAMGEVVEDCLKIDITLIFKPVVFFRAPFNVLHVLIVACCVRFGNNVGCWVWWAGMQNERSLVLKVL